MRRFLLSIFALLFTATYTAAQELPVELLDAELSPEMTPSIVEAVMLHRSGVDGDNDAVEEGVALLEGIDGDLPPIATGFLGSLYTMKGRDAKNVVDAMRFTNRGIRMIDEAVDADSEGYSVRMLRAINNIAIPVMFGRRDIALEDMKFLVQKYHEEDYSRSIDRFREILGHLISDAKEKGNSEDQAKYEAILADL